MRNLATYLVDILQANGVEIVFGIPGVHTVELYRGLEASGIRHVTPRHEQGAGFMADGYARVTGKPGVCFVITGPGTTNIATAMGQAYGDSIPMLVVSTVNSPGEMGAGQGHLHELKNQSALMREVSAFSHTILDVGEVEPTLARAFALFASTRARPVHIEIPVSLLEQDASAMPPARTFVLPNPPTPRADSIEEAADRLSKARRPLIIAGGGAKPAADAIRQLAHELDAPVMMTSNGRGILPGDDPLAFPFSGEAAGVPELIRDADVILALGTEFGPTDYWGALPARKDVAGFLIRVDLDPESMMRGILPDLPILADAAATAGALAERTQRTTGVSDGWGAARIAPLRKATAASLRPGFAAGLAMMDEIASALPEAIIVGDSCQPVYAACMAFGAPSPGSWFCSSTGFGTLGYGLPAAIGAALGAPDRPVIGVIGDGGIQFTLGELGSATEAGTNVRIILWNNDGYLEIKRYMQEQNIAPLGVDIFTPDFSPILAGYGWGYQKVSDLASLRALLATPAEGNELIEIDEATLVASLTRMDNRD